MICSEARTCTTRHWELVPEHNIKTSSQANAYVLLAAISALSNLFGERLFFSRNEQMVEQDEERRFKAKDCQ